VTSEGRVAWLALALLVLAGCGHDAIRRFPLAPPLRVDEGDYRPFAPMPEVYFSPFGWDAADQILFRPMSRFFVIDLPDEAVDVNAMDEVPDSSWYQNRASRAVLPIDRFERAACGDEPPLDPSGPWTIESAKPNGANPGFVFEDAAGRKYLLKFDSAHQPERATTADVLGSILYWAAGYHVPCNRIVFFDRDILRIDPGATAEVEGDDVPMTSAMLDAIMEGATRLEDGRYRAAASAFVEGTPIGPFRYEGTREDDPNDVVRHEDRRELRAGYVIASLINHFDTREQNTLDSFVEREGDRGFVRHHLLDFGDSLGSVWSMDPITRRLGNASYFDFRHFLANFFTLGAIPRPWHHAHYGLAGEALGYFDAERFVADRWQPGYPNPAFNRATERDLAWMARILANITDAHLEAALDVAEVKNDLVRSELSRILRERREKILRRWFRRISPLTWPAVERGPHGARVCLRDLVVATHLVEAWDERPYWGRAWHHLGGARLEPLEVVAMVRRPPDRICVTLPTIAGASPEAPAYLIVDVAGLDGFGDEEARPIRLHLYQLGPAAYRLVGIERPYDLDPPDAYDR
jgi:hypothetical protein